MKEILSTASAPQRVVAHTHHGRDDARSLEGHEKPGPSRQFGRRRSGEVQVEEQPEVRAEVRAEVQPEVRLGQESRARFSRTLS